MKPQITPTARRLLRALHIEPVKVSNNAWCVPSSTFEGVSYIVTVALARRFKHVSEIGAALDMECTCPSRVECRHITAVRRAYSHDASLLAKLLGLGEHWTYPQLIGAEQEALKAVAA